MKKLLLLCIVFSLTALFLLLLFTNSTSRPSSKDGLFQVNKFWKERTLESCPETPPGLVGSLRVGSGWNLTWDDVRKTRSSLSLQKGGRYKPPNCISNHKVAIVIPFRHGHRQLKHWLYHLHPIMQRQQLDYGVYVINQDGEGTLNRAKLMNIGYVESLKEYNYTCFVFSDVDVLPVDDRNLYRCFDNPRHLAAAVDKCRFQGPYRSSFGRVTSFSKDQFLAINGFPNTYWGSGGEDDDIYLRLTSKKMNISRPSQVVGKYKRMKHDRDLHNEVKPKRFHQLKRSKDDLDGDGIKSLKYAVKDIVKDQLYTFITVDVGVPWD